VRPVEIEGAFHVEDPVGIRRQELLRCRQTATEQLLEAFRSRGGKDLILTLGELNTYVEALKPQPRAGEFGDNAPGSDFVFVIK
jgi:hypothetical protein